MAGARRSARFVLWGFVITAVYTLLLSVWSRDAGERYRRREIARDDQYHLAVESGNPALLRSEVTRLLDESAKDFSGVDAMKLGAVGWLVLMAGYAGMTFHVVRRRTAHRD